jgi:hypothetical protein
MNNKTSCLEVQMNNKPALLRDTDSLKGTSLLRGADEK